MKPTLTELLAMGLLAVTSASAQEHVLERLSSSPRHHEWIDIDQGERRVRSFVVYPEVPGEATAVLVIHENKGLTDWVRGVADQLAEAGFVAIAPDLLSGMGPGGGNTGAFDSADAATQAIYALDQAQVTADLQAAADHALSLPACNGTLVVAGFCWGGGQALRFAADRTDLAAAFVFYGSAELTGDETGRIACPVYGFYGGNDARINATIPGTEAQMAAHGRTFEPVIYPGAGHGFMRAGEGPEAPEENRQAMDEAWDRWLGLLREL